MPEAYPPSAGIRQRGTVRRMTGDQLWTLFMAACFASAMGGIYLRSQRLRADQRPATVHLDLDDLDSEGTEEGDDTAGWVEIDINTLRWREAGDAEADAIEAGEWELFGIWPAYSQSGQEVTVIGVRLRTEDGHRYLVGGPVAGDCDDREKTEAALAEWILTRDDETSEAESGAGPRRARFHIIDEPRDGESALELREALGRAYRVWVDGDGPAVAATEGKVEQAVGSGEEEAAAET